MRKKKIKTKRKPTPKELNLICFLAKKGNRNVDEELNKIMVAPMNDGGMGSLVIFYDENDNEMADRHFGKQLSECTFEADQLTTSFPNRFCS